MNSKNSKISDSNRLLLHPSDKTDLKKKKQIYCFVKYWHLLYMGKYKKVI